MRENSTKLYNHVGTKHKRFVIDTIALLSLMEVITKICQMVLENQENLMKLGQI